MKTHFVKVYEVLNPDSMEDSEIGGSIQEAVQKLCNEGGRILHHVSSVDEKKQIVYFTYGYEDDESWRYDVSTHYIVHNLNCVEVET